MGAARCGEQEPLCGEGREADVHGVVRVEGQVCQGHLHGLVKRKEGCWHQVE